MPSALRLSAIKRAMPGMVIVIISRRTRPRTQTTLPTTSATGTGQSALMFNTLLNEIISERQSEN